MTTPNVAPEWLTPRKDSNPDQWRVSNGAPLFGFAEADHLEGRVVAPTNIGPMAELLRTYALVKARYGMTAEQIRTNANRHDVDVQAYELAHTHYLQTVTNEARDVKSADWKDGSGPLHAENVLHARTHADALRYAMTHIHTAQSNAIGRALTERDPKLGETYKEAKKKLARVMREQHARPTSRINGYQWNEMENHIAHLASIIDEILDGTTSKGEGDGEISEKGNPYKPQPREADEADWYPVIPAPVNLNRPHVGKIGTRRHATDTGKSIRHVQRLLTDPNRRVFSRRAVSRSALVVLDMSGSMNYSTEELDEILESCRGAVVVGYSAGDDTSPNFYLLAKDGHRVAEIPEVCGGNGNDGTAFTYAVKKYRKTPTTPVVWVSDGRVTGRGDYSTRKLSRDMIARLTEARATQCEDMEEALDVIAGLTRGKKPTSKIGPQLRRQAERHNAN